MLRRIISWGSSVYMFFMPAQYIKNFVVSPKVFESSFVCFLRVCVIFRTFHNVNDDILAFFRMNARARPLQLYMFFRGCLKYETIGRSLLKSLNLGMTYEYADFDLDLSGAIFCPSIWL